MIIYGSSPDAVAQQQQFYDQYNLGANQNNAARFDSAQARALQAALQQREFDQRAQDSADSSDQSAQQFNQRLAFQADQSALDRASREKDVATQYSSTHADRQDALNQRDFEQAQKLAMTGQTPQTEDELKLQYPKFDANQIKVLAQASSQHGLSRFQQAFDQSLKNGQPLQIDAIKNYVNPKSSLYQDAIDSRTATLAPLQMEHDEGQSKADKGNFASRIIADTSATPLDTSLGFGDFVRAPISSTAFALKNLISPSVPASSVIQPSGDWQSRAPAIIAALKSGQEPLVQTDAITGRFAPVVPDFNGRPAAPTINASQPRTLPRPTKEIASQFVQKYGQVMARQKLSEAGFDPSGYSN